MSVLKTFWHKICEPLDGYLWHRNIPNYLIRPLLRNQILASGALILAGGACFFAFPSLFWAGIGLLAITWVFWSWTKFFLRANIRDYSSAFLRTVLLRFFGRLALFAFLLYVALAICKAPAGALLVGMVCGAAIAIISSAYCLIAGRRRLP